VPRPLDQVNLASGVLLAFGSEGQKAHYLPRIRNAEDIWCQLFSEPGAGSDLAGIGTRARQREDGTFVVAGHKTWTTDGHWAQMGLALARTSSGPSRHAGLTAFAVPMDAPGLDMRPITTMAGAHEFNETFFDDVVLPADAVIGGVGNGWRVAMSGLELERFPTSMPRRKPPRHSSIITSN
jgi:alkylation response protein AidB-like acyl-CoA dehydrogenase